MLNKKKYYLKYNQNLNITFKTKIYIRLVKNLDLDKNIKIIYIILLSLFLKKNYKKQIKNKIIFQKILEKS